eukprot:gb/GECH01012634.1/.p1 GENE.gb/GECH01012634.1/~~gb/GECH01012634.1/.p1  ORF type:complete len:254 (+),score=46.31 gb/GECH01012634.1/:1-762(+)
MLSHLNTNNISIGTSITLLSLLLFFHGSEAEYTCQNRMRPQPPSEFIGHIRSKCQDWASDYSRFCNYRNQCFTEREPSSSESESQSSLEPCPNPASDTCRQMYTDLQCSLSCAPHWDAQPKFCVSESFVIASFNECKGTQIRFEGRCQELYNENSVEEAIANMNNSGQFLVKNSSQCYHLLETSSSSSIESSSSSSSSPIDKSSISSERLSSSSSSSSSRRSSKSSESRSSNSETSIPSNLAISFLFLLDLGF